MENKEKTDSQYKRQLNEKQSNISSEYSDINKLYKEMYEQRNKSKQKEEIKSDIIAPIVPNIKVSPNLISSYLNIVNSKPHFYINKLSHYPKDQLKDNMVSFREMLFEDILKTRSLIPNETPKRTLQAAFMTTFGFDSELLLPLVKANVHLVVANDYSKDTTYTPIIENFNGIDGLTIIQPTKAIHGIFYSCFHPKLWILKFPEFLRIVVSSGNLTTLDWSIWSNCLWYQDFYKKSMILKETEKEEEEKKKTNDFNYDKEFRNTLEDYMNKIIPKNITNPKTFLKFDLDDYVFENIDIILIPSYPGRHIKNSTYGLAKIRNIIKTLNPEVYQREEYVLTYQTSSLGTIDSGFLSDIAYGFLPNYSEEGNRKLYEDISNNVKVIYPTDTYITDESYAGPDFAHPLLLSEKNYEKQSFIKKVFQKFEGPDDYNFHHGILPHLKVGIVTKKDQKIDDDTIIYYGSHNFTAAAWGKYEKNRSQIFISNTELGVLIPGKIGSKSMKEEIVKGLSFKFPARAYDKDNKPWIASRYFNK